MIIKGEYKNYKDELLTVYIVSSSDEQDLIIGNDGLYFSSEPVLIEESITDLTEHIIRKSATINLVVSDYLGDKLFTGNGRDIKVNIWKGNVCLFAGFVEPLSFTQPFNSNLNEFTLNCTDYLSTLQYSPFHSITPATYKKAIQEAGISSFKTLLLDMFEGVGLDVVGNQKPRLYYDCSKGTTKGKEGSVFDELCINDLYLVGKDSDSTWNNEDLLKEIMQYLNLHIRQEGLDFYIYDWNTIRQGKVIEWLDLLSGSRIQKQPKQLTIQATDYSASDTNLSICEVVNQFQLGCSLEGQDTIIESPLESDSLKSHYKGKQLYMTEIISEGSGRRAHDAFSDMVQGRPTTYDSAREFDWYLQSMYNPAWKLKGSDVYEEKDSKGVYINQHNIGKYLHDNPLTPALLRFGSVKKQYDPTDNSPTSKLNSSDYLVISVGGNEVDTLGGHKPSDTDLKNCSPLLEYVGTKSGGVFSPSDENTTNYLVFSGSLLMQPIVYESSDNFATRIPSFDRILKNGARKTQGVKAIVPSYDIQTNQFKPNIVKSDNNGEGRYYTRKFYSATLPTDKPMYLSGGRGIQPFTEDKSAKGLKFEYSSIGDSTDKISKLPILECELRIGTKYCVETYIDMYGGSKFEWLTIEDIKKRPELTYLDSDGKTAYKTTFSLGINPKIGDYIIGQEYSLQNTIDYTMCLYGKEGTAIPIRQNDRLSGRVSFKILSPIQLVWDKIVRRHPTFFRSTKWSSSSRYVLAHTESIIIKDFTCSLCSDNGKLESFGDNDLIYCSAEQTKYINKHDSTEFKFVTQLSSEEAAAMGVKSSVLLNCVYLSTTGLPLRTIYNKVQNEVAKAEEHYVSQYYSFMSVPRLKVDVSMNDKDIDFTSTYYSSVLKKRFMIQTISRDTRQNTARVTLIEI